MEEEEEEEEQVRCLDMLERFYLDIKHAPYSDRITNIDWLDICLTPIHSLASASLIPTVSINLLMMRRSSKNCCLVLYYF